MWNPRKTVGIFNSSFVPRKLLGFVDHVSRIRSRTIIAVLVVTAVGCSQQVQPNVVPKQGQLTRSNGAIWRLIDQSIPRADRNFVYDELAILPPYARKNVLIHSRGRFYSNHLWMLRGAFVRRRRVSKSKDVVVADSTPPPCSGNNEGTGVSHKFCSDAGFQFFSASVSVPCQSSLLYGMYGENGFIYSGGTSPSTENSEIDAGIQFNGPNPSGVPTSVQALITLPQGTTHTEIGAPIHLNCDVPTTFQFWPAQEYEGDKVSLSLYIAGWGTLIERLDTDNLGWSQTCNCRIKRVTSLTVASGASVLVQGSFFGVLNPYSPTTETTGPEPTITWTNTTQGSFGGYGADAPLTTEAWASTDALDDPPNGQSVGLILSDLHDNTYEDVGISEVQSLVINARHKNHRSLP